MNNCTHLDKDGNCALHASCKGCKDTGWYELCTDYDPDGPAISGNPGSRKAWICDGCKYHNAIAKLCERGMSMLIVTNTTPIYRTSCAMYEKREDRADEKPGKPPLGIRPYYTIYPQRIEELKDAIVRCAGEEDADIEKLKLWLKEIKLLQKLMRKMEKKEEQKDA